jgi:reductive dehalogenase
MTEFLKIVFQTELLLLILFLFIFTVYSFIEKEYPAARKAIFLMLVFATIFLAHFILEIPKWMQAGFTFVFTLSFMVSIFPFGNKKVNFEIPTKKYDERDIMFSRMELKEGTEKFNRYYQSRPGNKTKDDNFRKEPGLLSPESRLYHPFLFNAAKATFSTVSLLQSAVETNRYNSMHDISTEKITAFIKNWALKLGASDVGFTLIKPYHLYSHIGRGKDYGKTLDLNHKYAIAFTVEMNHDYVKGAPQGTIIAESSQQYLNSGTIAVQIAEFIRNLGFDARAHIDANYRVICPAVAMDAGLGAIGRMGLLMTPKQGPRVRIGVVSTNLELIVNSRPIDSSVIHFCEICKKCAVNCPSVSISFDTGKHGNKFKRWTINHESCFTYWTKIGTDCGRCMAVCPYAHPNNPLHNFVRGMLKINPFNRRLALLLDNYFYGKKPVIRALEKWMQQKSN